MSVEDRRALKLIENSICLRDGHYQMGLLWKDDNPVLPYNRSLAEARLQYLKRRFHHDPELEAMSWVLRFVQGSRKKVPAYLKASTPQLVEIQQTSQEIVRLVQRQHVHEEYLCLKEGRQVK